MIIQGNCMEILADFPDNFFDSVVTDPPYHLVSVVKRFGKEGSAPAKHGSDGLYARQSKGFMGKTWDGGDISFRPELWAEVMRVLKPGGHMVAFGGSRTYHRMAVAIEDAGFEIRDQIMWLYGSGFPKSHDVSKGVEAQILTGGSSPKNIRMRDMGDEYRPHELAGTEHYGDGRMSRGADTDRDYKSAPSVSSEEAQQWEGWGTALKPAHEPIVLARKPLSEKSVASNVLYWGTGAINIDGCRVHGDDAQGGTYTVKRFAPGADVVKTGKWKQDAVFEGNLKPGRFPANLIHDGSDEVLSAFPSAPGQIADASTRADRRKTQNAYGAMSVGNGGEARPRQDSGSAARFFYCSKASKSDRGEGNDHPTVKPHDLMRYLCRLITPPSGIVLDPFCGSGSTGRAALAENFTFYGCEQDENYAAIAASRTGLVATTISDFRATVSIPHLTREDLELIG